MIDVPERTQAADLEVIPARIRSVEEDEQPLGAIEVSDLNDRAQVRKAKSFVLRWAKAHPDAQGWIAVATSATRILNGVPCTPIEVSNGKVWLSFYEKVMPKRQAEYMRRHNAAVERDQAYQRHRRAVLRHPQCPSCLCWKG